MYSLKMTKLDQATLEKKHWHSFQVDGHLSPGKELEAGVSGARVAGGNVARGDGVNGAAAAAAAVNAAGGLLEQWSWQRRCRVIFPPKLANFEVAHMTFLGYFARSHWWRVL